jgi:hypothetical protein
MPTAPAIYVTGEDSYRVDPSDTRAWVNARPPAERGPLLHCPRERLRIDPTTGRVALSSRTAGHVVARLEAERWLVDCPLPDPRRDDAPCGGAQFWTPSDPRFLCCSCGNDAVGGQWLDVIGPDPGQRAAIEAALLDRPQRQRRSWMPGESIEFLRAETEMGRGARERGWSAERIESVSSLLFGLMQGGQAGRRAVADALTAGEALGEGNEREGVG